MYIYVNDTLLTIGNDMRGGLALFLVCATVSGQTTSPLRCRRCIGATTLDDCTYSVPCPAGEVCYMDEVFTEQLTIEYNGGCRPLDVCSRGAIVGKRDGAAVICSKCCDTHRSPECNTKLCAIKSSASSANQCYQCSNDGNGGSGVKNPADCTNLVSCQSDEMCGSETYRLSSQLTYEFKCMHKQICTLLTKAAMEEMKYCDLHGGADPDRCNLVKRDSSGMKVCTACCGESQCNSGSCEQVIERLYNQWKAGVLDFDTLKTNGSLPTTTAASG